MVFLKVTRRFQLDYLKPSDKRYYIMDTPGFDTDDEKAVFGEIIRGINIIRPYAKIVGVMLVTRINDNRSEALDNKLITFIDKLCGPMYEAQITIVTNFWNVSEPEEEIVFDTRLREHLGRCRGVLGKGLKQYQHGRRYNAHGEDLGQCLKWRGNSEEIRGYAKAMIDRHYGSIDPRDPRIVQELSKNLPLHETEAGVFFGVTPPTSSSSSSPASGSFPRDETPPTNNTEPETEGGSKPSNSSRGANTNHSQSHSPPEQNGPGIGERVFKFLVTDLVVPIVSNYLTGGTLSIKRGGSARGFPSHLNPLSSRDQFLARGLPGDLGYRTKWAQAHNIFSNPGSKEFGDAVREAIIREHPL
ncbi:hypothetical protein B0J11DRAFT_503912 [Dendryphion nanum]|uniref:G domain-containing protein n=1 Tax=Dendryphion nanum TaxID=256645 RepID=A0A9P9IRT3_9PLEO|nr:hypothetical protein B0J11DRAFT_503912 [Dendryphion nanum]